jgi:hypothetical protein
VRFVLDWNSQWGSLPKVVISCLLVAFNLLWVTAALGFMRSGPEARATALLPLCFLPTLFIATDWARMLLFGFPALVLITAALPLKRLGRYVLPAASGAVSVWVQFTPPSLVKYLVTGALLLLAAAAVVASLARTSADRAIASASGVSATSA